MEDADDASPPLTLEQLHVLIFEALTQINSKISLQILLHLVEAMPQ